MADITKRIVIAMLLDKQMEIDESIISEFKLNRDFLTTRKILALQVEIGELMNEWEKFKFWKKSVRLKRSKTRQLEEYADGLHFILSLIGDISLAYPEIKEHVYQYPDAEYKIKDVNVIVNQALFLNELTGYLNSQSILPLTHLLQEYMNLGYMMGFSWDEVVKGFLKTHEKNMNRLFEGY